MTSALAKSEEELSSILNALKDSTRRVLEAKSKDGTEMPKERHEVVTRSIDDLRARLEDKLKKTVGILPEEPAAKRQRTDPEEPAEDDSPDEELKALENAVHEVATRVAAQREQVPSLLLHTLTDHMDGFRAALDAAAALPSALTDPVSQSAAPAGAAAPGELWQRFQQASNHVPALRVRLEKALDRLERMLSAVETEKVRGAKTPSTLERVLRERTEEAEEGGAGA